MAGWTGANTVRVPLNQQCWLGLGVKRAYGESAYQEAVQDYVRVLRDHGFVVVLDLHRSAPGDAASNEQEQMPDRDHSLEFWREVADSYKDDPAVVFDAFNCVQRTVAVRRREQPPRLAVLARRWLRVALAERRADVHRRGDERIGRHHP